MDYTVVSIGFRGKKYRAKLTRDDKLDIRCAGAYTGTRIMLSVYVMCLASIKPRSAETAGRLTEICVWRKEVPNWTSHEEQRKLLDFHATAAATKIGCDFEHRLPISTRPPKEN